MTPWTRRLIGPGRNRSAAPTQPMYPEAAHPAGWLSQEELDAMDRDDAAARVGHWEAVVKYSAFFLLGMLLGTVLAS